MNSSSSSEKEIFSQARELPLPARSAFLDRACARDRDLRARVEALLKADARAGAFLGTSLEARFHVPDTLGTAAGQTIGRYRLIEVIGEGGWGTVYRAEQREPVHRQVALKLIKLGLDTAAFIKRFEAERQALAMMNHPGIAAVYDAGAAANGRPYFVMELVEGERITTFCDRHQLGITARLEVFRQVCHGVQHAHQKGVIHRDLKPSNILVALVDGVPVPKIIDFGIAKATQGHLTDHTLTTAIDQFVGTPSYASPEQVVAGWTDVDTRSDIYSLGAVLYELLVGSPPFDADSLSRIALAEVRRMIREVDPPRLSTRLNTLKDAQRASIAHGRKIDPPRLLHRLRGDLEWIAARCLEKDRSRRYESADALAADIERHLQHEPITARSPSTSYRIRKYIRRNRMVVATASTVAIALLLGIAASSWQAIRATRAERTTAAAHFEAIARREIVEDEYGDNTRALAHAIAALERGDTWERRRLAMLSLWRAPVRFQLPPVDGVEPAGWTSFNSDGKWLATGSPGPQVLLWPSNGGAPRIRKVEEGTRVVCSQFSLSGHRLLTIQQADRPAQGAFTLASSVVLWDWPSLQRRNTWEVGEWAPYWLHPDESKLLAYCPVKRAPYAGVAWCPVDGGEITPLGSPRAEPPIQLRFPPWYVFNFYPSEDLRWLVSWEGRDVYVSPINETSLGQRVWIGSHERLAQSASLDAHGDLVSSADNQEMYLWSRAHPGQPLARMPSAWTPAIFDLPHGHVFARWPNVDLLVSYDLRGPMGSAPLPYLPSGDDPEDPAVSSNGAWVAIAPGLRFGFNPTRKVGLYPTRAVWPFRVDLRLDPTGERHDAKLSPDGRWIAADRDGQLLLVDLMSPDLARRVVFEAPERHVIYNCAFDPSGDFLLVGTHLSGTWLVPLKDGEPTRLEGSPNFGATVAFSPSGNRLAVGGGFWDTAAEQRYSRVMDRDGRVLARLEATGGAQIHRIAFLSETELLVSAQGGLRWWNTETGEVRQLRPAGRGSIAVSEHYFLHDDADVWLFDRATQTPRRLDGMDPRNISATAIAPDESFVVAGYRDGSIRVRYLAEDRPHYLPGSGGRVDDLRIDPKGRWIAAITTDSVTYWPVPHGRPLNDRPLDEFLAVLKAQTNIRVVSDPDSAEGYREVTTKFPGWETVPIWQEWYSDKYMQDPPWTPMLDPAVLKEAAP